MSSNRSSRYIFSQRTEQQEEGEAVSCGVSEVFKVLLLWETHMTSILRNRHDYLSYLFAMQKNKKGGFVAA